MAMMLPRAVLVLTASIVDKHVAPPIFLIIIFLNNVLLKTFPQYI